MEFIDQELLTEEQLWIIRKRVEGVTYRNIKEQWDASHDTKIRQEAIEIAILRSVMGYHWKKGCETGPKKYLCKADTDKLAKIILDKSETTDQLDAGDVIETVYRIKLNRLKQALQFLKSTNSPSLAEKLNKSILEPPSRPWLNNVLDELEAAIKNRRLIDPKRLESCSKEVIMDYFTMKEEILNGVPPCILIGADETMIDAVRHGKVVVADNVQEALQESFPSMPHISVMCAHSCTGKKFTPMIILKDLKNLPYDLEEYSNYGLAVFTSSPTGWQTRDTFLYWCLLFINEMSIYRLSLSAEYREKRALLIMDGHVSRECPLGIAFLKFRKIDVLILPPHTTHVLQMFDVSIASPLKTHFTKEMKSQLTDMKKDGEVTGPKVRKAAVDSFIVAYSSSCTIKNCRSGAEATGTYPVSKERVLENHFVRELTEEEKEKERKRAERNTSTFTISQKVITEDENLVALDQTLKDLNKFSHLRLQKVQASSYSDFVKETKSAEHNGCKLLSPLPPFISDTGKVNYFDKD